MRPEGLDGWIAAVVLDLGTLAFIAGCLAGMYLIFIEG